LDGPATCPHGNPIPGTGAILDPSLRPISEFPAGSSVVLGRLLEDVELDDEAMRYFEEHGLIPGAELVIESVDQAGGMQLRVGAGGASLAQRFTDNLWVRPSEISPQREAVAARG
ncbi:MAG TPA: ferrous iron transport protein A, partial [Actinomycetota bacterium]|nr:ferrous iron transport protein A [Actinomycetota bacterium]